MSDSPPTLDATVVVCTRDRPRLVADAVRSVIAGDTLPAEIVVVDQGRTAELTAGLEGQPLVRRIAPGAVPVSRARNAGAAAAHTEIVAFIDDDELVEPGWLGAIVGALASGARRVATGRVVAGAPEVDDPMIPATVLSESAAVHRGRLDHDVLAGGNMALRRTALLEVGGWDESLGPGTRHPAAEDNDLGLRLLDAGFEIAYVPEAVVVHRAWRPARHYPATRWRYGLGKGGFYAKHGLTGYGGRRAARDVSRRLTRAPVAVWRHPRYAAGELAYAAGVVAGALRRRSPVT